MRETVGIIVARPDSDHYISDELAAILDDVETEYVRIEVQEYSERQKEADEALYEAVTNRGEEGENE